MKAFGVLRVVTVGLALWLPPALFAQEPSAAPPTPPPPAKKADAPRPAPAKSPSPIAPPIRTAPRPAVDAGALAPLAPAQPPPYAGEMRSDAVRALFAAAEKSPGEDDAARWIEAGSCWVWYAAKRDAPWSRYRFTFEGGCHQGRAEGRGRLIIDRVENGATARQADFSALWHKGVPVAEGRRPAPTTLLVGLPDRSVLAWVGPTARDEADVFAVGRADDDGRATPCKAQSLLAVALKSDLAPIAMKTLMMNAAGVMGSACPDRGRALWPVILVGTDLTLVGRQGSAVAQPVLAVAEVKDGLIYAANIRPSEAPTLIPQTVPVAGAQPLTWVQPEDEFEADALLIYTLPVGLVIGLLALMRIAGRRRAAGPRPATKAPKPKREARAKGAAAKPAAAGPTMAPALSPAGDMPAMETPAMESAAWEEPPLDLVEAVPPPAQAKSSFLKGLFTRKASEPAMELNEPLAEPEFFPEPPPEPAPPPPPKPVAAGARFAKRPSVPISRVPATSSEERR